MGDFVPPRVEEFVDPGSDEDVTMGTWVLGVIGGVVVVAVWDSWRGRGTPGANTKLRNTINYFQGFSRSIWKDQVWVLAIWPMKRVPSFDKLAQGKNARALFQHDSVSDVSELMNLDARLFTGIKIAIGGLQSSTWSRSDRGRLGVR